jgi:hypothetical protein
MWIYYFYTVLHFWGHFPIIYSIIIIIIIIIMPISVAVLSKAWFYGRSFAGIMG